MGANSTETENGDDREYVRWLVGKLLDPDEDEFRDAVIYSQVTPISDEEIEAILDEFSEDEIDELIVEMKSMAADVPDRVRSMNRREFLKTTVKVAATGALVSDIANWVGTAGEAVNDYVTQKSPAYYENFWPNSIKQFSELNVEDTERLLRSSRVSWSTFVDRSNEMLSEVVPGDVVHIHGFFYRGYPESFFKNLLETSRTAEKTIVYLADPLNGENGASAIELHQERELLIHEYLLTQPEFKDTLATPEDQFSWTAVPHLRHLVLNNVRALLHGLRFLETAYYFSKNHDIRFQPISRPTESPLRGRIILDATMDPKKAAFLYFEKGVIGTSNASNGHLLCDTEEMDLSREALDLHQMFVEDFLQNEQQQLRADSPGRYSLSDVEDVHQEVRQRINTLLEEGHTNGPLTEDSFAEIRNHLEMLDIPSEWQDNSSSLFQSWVEHRKNRFETIKTIRRIIKADIDDALQGPEQSSCQSNFVINPLTTPELERNNSILEPDNDAPKAVYDAALRYQDLK